jgi:hypothetical protein
VKNQHSAFRQDTATVVNRELLVSDVVQTANHHDGPARLLAERGPGGIRVNENDVVMPLRLAFFLVHTQHFPRNVNSNNRNSALDQWKRTLPGTATKIDDKRLILHVRINLGPDERPIVASHRLGIREESVVVRRLFIVEGPFIQNHLLAMLAGSSRLNNTL